ncbi:MAG: hypothetical protein QXX67_04725 [Metallosphaera sp.]
MRASKRKGVSGIIASIILIIIFISAVSVILYFQNVSFQGIRAVTSDLNNIPASIVELPGDRVYSDRPVTIAYVIYPDGETEQLNMSISSDPVSISSIIGGYKWAILVTNQGEYFNVSNIPPLSQTDTLTPTLPIPDLPPGSVLGAYSIQDFNVYTDPLDPTFKVTVPTQSYYYVPGQYNIGDEIPQQFQSYASSNFENFNPIMTQGFTFIYPQHFEDNSIYNASLLFPFYNGTSINLNISWSLGQVFQGGTFSAGIISQTLGPEIDCGYFTLPLSLVITSGQSTEWIWIEYHSYSEHIVALTSYTSFGVGNVMDNPDIGFYIVKVNGITAISQVQQFQGSLSLDIQDTPKGLEFLINGEPLVFNSVSFGSSGYQEDTPFVPAHLIHGVAIVNLPAGSQASSGSTEVKGNPSILLSGIQILNRTTLEGVPTGSVSQVGDGGVTLVNTGIFCYVTQGNLYMYEVNVTLDSTYNSIVYADPVIFNGNQYYIGTWGYFSPNIEPLTIYPGVHSYKFYFGVTYSYVQWGTGLTINPSLDKGQIYTSTLPLSNGGEASLNLVAY